MSVRALEAVLNGSSRCAEASKKKKKKVILGNEIADQLATSCSYFIPFPIKILYSDFSPALKAYASRSCGPINEYIYFHLLEPLFV